MASLATPGRPEGGALPSILDHLAGVALSEAALGGPGPEPAVRERLAPLTELPCGFDFARVVECYIRGHDAGDQSLQDASVRWLRGELPSKVEARALLGVHTVVGDANWLDNLKLLARLVRLAGYGGLVCLLDEAAVLQRIQSPRARDSNYEVILRMWIDANQGVARGLGVVMATTPEAVMNPRRGLYSHGALRSRMTENAFAVGGLQDRSGAMLHLAPLGREELFLLLGKLNLVFAAGSDEGRLPLPDEALLAFVSHSERRWGDRAFRSPRETIRSFLDLLAVLEQNSSTSWEGLLDTVEDPPAGPDDELESFRL